MEQYVCRYDPEDHTRVVLESDWRFHIGMILLILIASTFTIFICCFLCLCLGILCSDRIKEKDYGYTTLA